MGYERWLFIVGRSVVDAAQWIREHEISHNPSRVKVFYGRHRWCSLPCVDVVILPLARDRADWEEIERDILEFIGMREWQWLSPNTFPLASASSRACASDASA